MNMLDTIIPKSDQLNADDLIGRDLTIKITNVAIKGGQEQPIAISFDGDAGKPYKPCKSMCRVMVTAWGADSQKYIGRTMTLYRDPKVAWGGMAVGGIRISHMSDIDSALTMALTVTRANKKPFTVRPIASGRDSSEKVRTDTGPHTVEKNGAESGESPRNLDTITPDEALKLEARGMENGITVEKIKRAFGVERLSAMTGEQLVQAHEMIDTTIEKRKVTA